MADTNEDLANTVVSLNHTNSFVFPSTKRLTDKSLVVKDHLFFIDYSGNFDVYSLKRNEVVSGFTGISGLESVATDGNNMYFHIVGDFEVRDTDILLARLGEEENFEFIGKSLKELPSGQGMYGKAEKNKIQSRIVSFPLETIINNRHSLVFNTSMFTDNYTRFLVPLGMSPSLISKQDYLTVGSSIPFDGLHNSSFRLKNGKLDMTPSRELTNLVNKESYGLEICSSVNSPYLIEAQMRIFDEEEEYEERTVPLNIVFENGGVPSQGSDRILRVQLEGDNLHILKKERISKHGEPDGIYRIDEPGRLDSYKVLLKKLEAV